MSDILSVFFTRPVWVRRKLGDGAHGPVIDDTAEELRGRVKFARKLVVNSRGDEVVSEAAISLPITTAVIPVGSEVSVDQQTWHTVLVENRHIGGFARSPDYYSIDLA